MRYRILSCDGGGIRGVISAIWLARLEHKLGGRLRDHFDLIAGTSTGSILGCGIAWGVPVADIVDIYLKRGREVFPGFMQRFWKRIGRTFSEGLSAPRYDGAGFERVLRDVFAEARFGDLAIRPTMAVSYNTFNRHPVVFKNTSPEFADMPIWEVIRSSAAAPVYFPAHVTKIDRATVPLIDGAVVANNPTACAVAEAMRLGRSNPDVPPLRLENLVVASFGTGQATRQIDASEARSWGGLQWLFPVIDVMFDGASGAVDYIAKQLLPPEQYFRVQCRLESAYDDLDNATDENLNALVATAEEHLTRGGDEQLNRLAAALRQADQEPVPVPAPQAQPEPLAKPSTRTLSSGQTIRMHAPSRVPAPAHAELFRQAFRRKDRPDSQDRAA